MRTARTTRVAALAATLSGAMVVSMLSGAGASSHREAPLITEDPVADNTDVYAYVNPANPDTVVLQSNFIPLQEPSGGPNYFAFGDDVLYEIHVDTDGDAVEDVTYEFKFRTVDSSEPLTPGDFLYNTGPIDSLDDPDWKVKQFYTLTRVEDGRRTVLGQDLAVPPVNIGPRSTPDYPALATAAEHELPDGSMVFAGQRDEAFPVDLGSIFDLGGLRPLNELHVIPLPAEDGVNATLGYNVHSLVLQVPKSELVEDDDVIGVWSTASRRQVRVFQGGEGDRLRHAGHWVQVSRLGNPLVNEVVVPRKLKNTFNASHPADDAQFAPAVVNPTIDNLVAGLYGGSGAFECFPDVDADRPDIVAIFLTGLEGVNQPANVVASEMLRLNTATAPTPFADQNRLGLLGGDADGFPNGRRLGDDVVDIAFQAVAGAAGDCAGVAPNNALGDGAQGNDMPLETTFPYAPLPHQGYESGR